MEQKVLLEEAKSCSEQPSPRGPLQPGLASSEPRAPHPGKSFFKGVWASQPGTGEGCTNGLNGTLTQQAPEHARLLTQVSPHIS
jgi:hypothetical protein